VFLWSPSSQYASSVQFWKPSAPVRPLSNSNRNGGGNNGEFTPLPAALDCRGHWRGLVVTDSAGQKLAYVYYEDEPGRRIDGEIAHQNEARRVAANIAKLPNLRHEQSE